MAADHVGQQLGNYRLLQRLGEGGFAEVYLGEHIYLKTQAAIKILHTRLAADDTDSFVSEAQIIARLKHPHIVRVLDFGVESGTPFLVMDYAPNGTLRQRHRKGTRLEPTIIATYVKQIAEALHYAHEQKLVHRDVKPENMLLGERDEVLLSDFGIATVAQSSRYQGTQEVAGTVAYMAPEQVQGKPRPASDQYALGIVVYEWLAGERPFHGSFTEIATQQVLTPPPPLHEKAPGIPPMLEAVVMTALAKDPKERFASIQAFANAFEQTCQPATSQPVPAWQIPPDAATRPAGSSEPSFFSAPTRLPSSQQAGSTFQSSTASVPPTSQATPPGWKDAAGSAPAAQAVTFGGLPSALPSTIQVATPPQKGKHPRRHPSQRLVIMLSLILVVLLAGGVGTWIVVSQPFTFHQIVSTSVYILDIHVGTGFDQSRAAITGETDTFKAGEAVFVGFHTRTDVAKNVLSLQFVHSDNTTELVPILSSQSASYIYWAILQLSSTANTGVYQWVLYYGSVAGRITFQVTS